jgi:hypothetical protein
MTYIGAAIRCLRPERVGAAFAFPRRKRRDKGKCGRSPEHRSRRNGEERNSYALLNAGPVESRYKNQSQDGDVSKYFLVILSH